MKTNKEKKKFNQRAFVSVSMCTAFFILPISGYMNHILRGPMDQSKHLWMSVHNSASILFLVFAIIHIVLNWQALKKHISKTTSAIITKEALLGIALIIAVIALFSSHAFHI